MVATGELEKTQAAVAFELGKKKVLGVGVGCPVPTRENTLSKQLADWAGFEQIARGRAVPNDLPGDCAPPCHVIAACQTSKCGKTKTYDF